MNSDSTSEKLIYKGVLRQTKVVIIIIPILIIAFIYYLYSSFFTTPARPTLAETKQMEGVLRDYAEQQWGNKADLKKLDIKEELHGSDFPINREWEEYRYFAYYQINRTKAVFFASLPIGVKQDELKDWSMLSSKLNSDEIELLKTYSEATTTPASIWTNDKKYGLYADKYPGKSIWTVEPVVYGHAFSYGFSEYVFERLSNGKFRLLEYKKSID